MLVLVAIVVALALAAPVQAAVQPQSWVDGAEGAAQSYWQNTIPQSRWCSAVPTVDQVELAGRGGEADWSTCTIRLDSDIAWTPYTFCIAMLHEWGHLTLGPTYFAATNPADPAHSSDPTSIMNAAPSIYTLQVPQCDGFDAGFTPASRPIQALSIAPSRIQTPSTDARPTAAQLRRAAVEERAAKRRLHTARQRATDAGQGHGPGDVGKRDRLGEDQHSDASHSPRQR